ncbi:hypothetical protein GGH94_005747 [Coemansia aciculifera]|uniref:SPRY-domain-containing protein n=1 Tax=Coemansia aciculifera TaxID=417176 RepID=A0A9W8ICY1_9FUNG|nr:hypothetical protein GGH94_005747 [Coemansia aciculifera]
MDNRRINIGTGSTWISMRRTPSEDRDNEDDPARARNQLIGLEARRRALGSIRYDDETDRTHAISFEGGSESDEAADQGDGSQDEDRDRGTIFARIRSGLGAADDDDEDSDEDDSDEDEDMDDIHEDDEELEVDIGGIGGHMFSSGEDHSDGGDSDSPDEEFVSASHIAQSHENLPSLVSSTTKKSRSGKGDRSSKQQFMPKYLEKTAYGAMHHHLLEKGRKAGSGANDSASSRNGGAGDKTGSGLNGKGAAEHGSASARIAPDLFFRTLAQDTWPHYCSSVPAVPAIAGLRLGYGLGLDDRLAVDPGRSGDSSVGTSQLRNSGAARGNPIGSNTGFSARRLVVTGVTGDGIGAREQPIQRNDDRRSRLGSESSSEQRLPSGWQPVKNLANMAVDSDRVSLRYTGPGRQDQDAAMVRSNYSIPTHTGVYYFEVTIKSRGQSGYIGVGLSQGSVAVHRLPGWDAGSWGYHGDDGNSFSGDGRGSRYGPGFTTGDTVGCGIDFTQRRIFFTRNGFFLGYAFDKIDTTKDLFPCVGMRTLGEHVKANFGRKPFVYDISHFVSVAHEDALKLVSGASIRTLLPPTAEAGEKKDDAKAESPKPDASSADLLSAVELMQLRDSEVGVAVPGQSASMDESGATLGIVLSYLLHNEYFSTARALIENVVGRQQQPTGSDEPATESSARLAAIYNALSEQDAQRETRRRICKHIGQGDIDYALGLLQDAYPSVLENESLVFQLRCRQFIELVRASNGCHIADCVPSDDSQLPVPVARTPATPANNARAAEDMMDVDDTCTTSMMSLAAITNAPNSLHRARFGQISSLRKMEAEQLVRVLLEYGRQLQADYGASPNPIIREGLVHTFSLLAYADPAQSPIAALLDPAACEPLACLVDAAIVATENAPRMSALECICRHAGALLTELSARRNGAASLLSIKRDFLRVPGFPPPESHAHSCAGTGTGTEHAPRPT